MSYLAAASAYRSLSTSLHTSSPGNLQRAARTALRSHGRHSRPRSFSSTSIARAGTVNLARPTTRTSTTSTSSTRTATAPTSLSKSTESTSSAPPASSTAKPAPAKTAVPVRVTSTPTKPAPRSDITSQSNIRSLKNGLSDEPPPTIPSNLPKPSTPTPDAIPLDSSGQPVDWSRSFHGLSSTPFSKDSADVLMAPINPDDVEIKPDGILYLPEIKYRRILNRAFGPGGWGMAPRGETIVTPKSVTREYGLVVHGRLISLARGEQQYFDPEGIPTATEGCKSNALMRCCKDLGIASELWDPVFIRKFMAEKSREVWVEHMTTKKKRKIIMRRDVSGVSYPWKEVKG